MPFNTVLVISCAGFHTKQRQKQPKKSSTVNAVIPICADMEWMNTGQEEMEVDIGYMPRMEWTATRSSLPAMLGDQDLRHVHINATEDHQSALKSIKWTAEIPEKEARRALEVALYPFKEVHCLC